VGPCEILIFLKEGFPRLLAVEMGRFREPKVVHAINFFFLLLFFIFYFFPPGSTISIWILEVNDANSSWVPHRPPPYFPLLPFHCPFFQMSFSSFASSTPKLSNLKILVKQLTLTITGKAKTHPSF